MKQSTEHMVCTLFALSVNLKAIILLLQKGSVGSILWIKLHGHLQLSFCKLGLTMIQRQSRLLTSVFKSWLNLNKSYPLFKCTHRNRFFVILLLPMLLLEFFWNILAACALLSVASFFHRAAAMSTAFAAAPQVTTPGIKANLVGIGMSPRESLNKQPGLSFEAFEATNCRFFRRRQLAFAVYSVYPPLATSCRYYIHHLYTIPEHIAKGS